MDPPGLKDSPSMVTIRRLWWYFFAMAIAWSIWSTTRTLPRRYLVSPVYSFSVVTRSEARPITPASFNASFWLNSPLVLMLFKGRNVARPKRFFFRYSIILFAVCSLSVTIFWILPPRAVSMAISYSLLTWIRSATTPRMPDTRSFCSMTLRILLPYPS